MNTPSFKSLIFLGPALLLAAGCAGTPDTPEESIPPEKPAVSVDPSPTPGGEKTIDYRQMRMTYALSPDYDPYQSRTKSLHQKLRDLLREEHYQDALPVAAQILRINRLDIRAHIYSDLINRKLERKLRADYHRSVARGLLDSIFKSGNGRTPETAYRVIDPSEEEAVMLVLGLKKEKQALLERGNRVIDRIEVADPESGETFPLFFDVTIPFDWAGSKLKSSAPIENERKQP